MTQSQPDHRTNRDRRYWSWALKAAATVVVLIVTTPFFVWLGRHWTGNLVDAEGPGSFGDQFGFATALFSGLAFAGLILTLLMQRDEMRDQQDLFALQLKEIQQTNDSAVTQLDRLERQTFENSLFQMIGVYREVLGGIVAHRIGQTVTDPVVNSKMVTGPEATRAISETLYESYRRTIAKERDKKGIAFDLSIRDISAIYTVWYADTNLSYSNLGHYFRMVYNIFRFIDEADFNNLYKIRYSRIFRAQISDSELILLFYNCLGSDGHKMLIYALRYELFDNLDRVRLFKREHMRFLQEHASEHLNLDWCTPIRSLPPYETSSCPTD